MLGKTNILFVSKGDAEEGQLVYEKNLTPTTGAIKKIEFINNMFFVYTSDKAVLRGTDVRSLEFIKKDGENLVATHFIFHDGKYYFCNAYERTQQGAIIYETENFADYEEIIVENETYITESQKAVFTVAGLFKDSRGKVVVMTRIATSFSSITHKANLHVFDSFGQNSGNKRIAECDDYYITEGTLPGSVMLKDRIFIKQPGTTYVLECFVCDLEGNCKKIEPFEAYVNDYFFNHTEYEGSDSYLIRHLYKSFDGVNWAKCSSFNIQNAGVMYRSKNSSLIHVFPINGRTCLIYKNNESLYINVADNVSRIGDMANATFEVDLGEFDYIHSVAEDNEGNTYLGFDGGIIVKLYIDQDGTTKLPEVQLVKTLAAKQALAQAKQYTDEKVAELKAYFDSNLGQQ